MKVFVQDRQHRLALTIEVAFEPLVNGPCITNLDSADETAHRQRCRLHNKLVGPGHVRLAELRTFRRNKVATVLATIVAIVAFPVATIAFPVATIACPVATIDTVATVDTVAIATISFLLDH